MFSSPIYLYKPSGSHKQVLYIWASDYYAMRTVLIFVMFVLIILISGCFREESVLTTETERSGAEIKTEAEIQSEIENANYCDTKEDCMKVNAQCPFGCNVYVNVADGERIQALLDSFVSNCEYRCQVCESVECRNNQCEPVCG